MVISEIILLQYGAELKSFKPKEIIFKENGYPYFYLQIQNGSVKLNNYTADGSEFIHNVLGAGQSVGESLLFNEKAYPMNAIAMTHTTILSLNRSKLFQLIEDKPEISLKILRCLADRYYYKSIMILNNARKNPIEKIWFYLNYLKTYHFSNEVFSYEVRLTRQQIANLTGLSIESTIRSIKFLEREKRLIIRKGKILL